ncbi:MAG: hypothetical protein WCY27_00450 [archaeon]|jgi:hypothetical protein|nr:hypothetical protein [archaeon]MDD2477355.1 hypothetical protein [Candidatus ainarchaeum sp.]MDD3084532.1 hypothetical protein [Candidatus ainarchaeum sp.]MDD4220813.1 hypothetical protein [Candidatus ainarchaeum sp.]MDD4662313.1 hypothetical protein [Candidatus ainarchaeum sp.]
MIQYWALIGLSVVSIAWIIQLISTWNGEREIKKWFVFLYMIGVVSLIIDGILAGLNNIAFLNIITLLLSIAVFIRLIKPVQPKKKK